MIYVIDRFHFQATDADIVSESEIQKRDLFHVSLGKNEALRIECLGQSDFWSRK